MSQASEKFLRPIDDVVETLRNAKERGTKCSILIGAGCSVTANIPTAQGFVDVIQKKYPTKYNRADPKTYPSCMSELSTSEQRALIAEYVDKSKINWGHIALAQLIKEGYVDRVLTTNFDSLIVRACALLGIFPAVYDFASSQDFQPDKVPGQAVFYLHGQRTGFVLMNEEKVLSKQSQLLAPVFTDAGRGRVWMVVGYSGENDPVFNHLADIKRFDNNLYWVGYRDNEPGQHVLDNLLSDEKEKDAYFVKGFDSDSFFVTLAQMLGCFPPEFVSKPFSHLENLFDNLTDYTFPKINAPVNAMWYARNFVHEAVEKIEGVQSDVLQAWSDLLGGQNEKVIELQAKYSAGMHPEIIDAVSWAYVMQGNDQFDKAQITEGAEAEGLFKQAVEKYDQALKIQPERHEALNNWALALDTWARRKEGVEADGLFTQASEKYAEAVKLKPDDAEKFNNWALALHAWAWRKEGVEADDLFKQAVEKCAEAVKIMPTMHEALNNWASVLDTWARRKEGVEADDLFKQAVEKYAEAVKIKPDDADKFNNWGLALYYWAWRKDGVEADELFKQAGEKYDQALKIQPDKHEVLNNWGLALDSWARKKDGVEADELFKQASEKYAEAVKLKPDDAEKFNNWGLALYYWAGKKEDTEAEELFKQAGEKFAEAVKIMPAMHEALNNWGLALYYCAWKKEGAEAEGLFKQAGEKYAEALKIQPDKHEALNNWGLALDAWARRKEGVEADELFKQAGEKYAEAVKIKPDDANILNNWGLMLDHWANGKHGVEADELFKQADKNYAQAAQLKDRDAYIFNNWGLILDHWARNKEGDGAVELFQQADEKYSLAIKIKSDDEVIYDNWGIMFLWWNKVASSDKKEDLLKKAKEVLLRAEEIKDGSGAYDLACTYSLLGEDTECLKWLQKSKDVGRLPDREYLEKDKDLESVREKQWFKDFLATLE